jgi:hypothetical protein
MSRIESTYKSRDVEETLDIYFYRPLGYVVAKACVPLRLSPNAVTIISIVIGAAAGHLFYYRDFNVNLWGMALWVVSDILDSADGQLARMINHRSKVGRILDGFAGNLIFVSMYLHLLARMIGTFPEVAPAWFFLVVLAGGASHSMQSALADYYRIAYLQYVVDPDKSDLEGSDQVRTEYDGVRWADQPVRKFLLRVYLNYTMQQEAFSRNFQRLRKTTSSAFGTRIPGWFADEYRRLNRPLMKYYAILTTNTRMIVMCAAVLLDTPLIYFATEIILINILMIVLTRHQEKVSAGLLERIADKGVTA